MHQSKYAVFAKNYVKVEEHNAMNLSYKLGINAFSDMSEEEFLSMYGKSG